MDTKGNIKGDCAREPGEGKPKCLPQAKAHAIGKDARATAARRKRREDPNPERRGAPINVKTESVFEACWRGYKAAGLKKKGDRMVPNCVPEEVEQIEEKNVPTSPEKWARAKAAAKSKFAVYPSAYANGWASKKYKAMGGGWKSVSEDTDLKDRFKKYIKPTVKTTPKIERISNPSGRTTDHVEYKVTEPTGMVQRFKSKKEAQAHYDSLKEDGAMGGSAGPTNVVSSGAIAGSGLPKGGEPGVYLPRRKKSPVMMSIRRKPPKA